MTDARFEELAAHCRWHSQQSHEIERIEQDRADFGTFDYQHNRAAYSVLNGWAKEKEAALNATDDEWNEYERIVEGACEAAYYRARGER